MNPPLEKTDKVVITGAAGLVGQNLVALLRAERFENLVAIDKHSYNLGILRELHPGVRAVDADLADPGAWEQEFAGARVVVLLHAQITGKAPEPFVRNNITATEQVLRAIVGHGRPYVIGVSSSVVNSVADDEYTNTKRAQEGLVRDSGLDHCILRPTLMFGWFDPKHLGWLSRFMEKTPLFPIPGHGRYMRQPLYNQDFCRVILRCMLTQPRAEYDLVGPEQIDYIDIIRAIKRAKKLRTPVVRIPFGLFSALLKVYALFSDNPPFTADQLKALTAGDRFTGVDMEQVFDIKPTPFQRAVDETFADPRYSGIVLRPTF